MRLTQIRLQRLTRGLLQLQLSQQTRIARSRLSEIECGYVEPRTDELQRIARVLGCNVDELRAGGGEVVAVDDGQHRTR